MSGFLRSLIGSGSEQKSASMSDALWSALLGGPAKSGVTVTIESALKVATVFACVRALSEGVSMPPFHVFRPTKDGRGHEIAKDHPVERLIARRPNPWQTPMEWRETMMIHAVLTGNAVCYKNRAGGVVRELIPILPGNLMIEQQRDYTLIYRVVFADGSSVQLRREDVWHLKGPSYDSYSGMDAVRLAREQIGLAMVTEEAHARLHANGARPGGILTTPDKLSNEQITSLREAWNAAQGGIANAFNTAVMHSGLKFEAMAMTGVDAQHIETRKFQIEEMCRSLGVYPQRIRHTDKTSTFASAEAFNQAHIDHDLLPWAERIEQVTNRDLLTDEEIDAGYYTDMDFSYMLRGNLEARGNYYAKALGSGGHEPWITVNEIRDREGGNPVPWGDDKPVTVQSVRQQTNDGAK